MAYRTLGEAKQQVVRHLSLTNATNMTPYSDELIISYLNGAHEFIKGECEWSELVLWYDRTLSGVNGLITVALPHQDWKSIRRIYHESFQTPLPLLSSYANPIANSLLLGYRGLPTDEDTAGTADKYLVKFYPLTNTGRVLFQIEKTFDWTDQDMVLPIDWWLHVYHASWQYALDDGTNPAQADKYETLYNQRMKQIRAAENARPILMQPNQVIPNDWFEQDAPYT